MNKLENWNKTTKADKILMLADNYVSCAVDTLDEMLRNENNELANEFNEDIEMLNELANKITAKIKQGV